MIATHLYPFLLRIAVGIVTGIMMCSVHLFWPVHATQNPYHVTVNRPLDRYIVNDQFTKLQSTFSVTNNGDPVYMLVEPQFDKELVTVSMNIQNEPTRISSDQPILLLKGQSQTIDVHVSALQMFPEERDYTIDIRLSIRPIYVPRSDDVTIVAIPRIYKYVVLSHTRNETLSIDPKIALFQNKGGSFVLSTQDQEIVAVMQNRGKHLMLYAGELSIRGPGGYTKTTAIPTMPVSGQGQVNVLTQTSRSGSTLTIPRQDLRTGRYDATIEITTGNNSERIYASTSFWVLSPWFVGLLIVICFVMIGIILITSLFRR